MSDEGFHEIQLNGKQLVFLFMAATVVSVVIFLCGVMVGRGVRDRTGTVAPEAAASTAPTDTASAPVGESAAPRTPAETSATSGSAQAQPPPPQQEAASTLPGDPPPTPAENDDDYYDNLVKDQKNAKVGAARSRAPAEPVKSPERPAAKNTATPSVKPAAPAAVAEHASTTTGYAVQLVAVRERGEADAIARRLVAKGYQAYVLVPQPGKPPVYRVQVGRFKNRGEADKVASRLRKDEQFKPWVTR
jgi:septal ring-binding cell division protein DamX